MNHVRQLNWDGCGIASLAMVMGVTYAQALKAVFGKKTVSNRMVSCEELIDVLRRCGFGVRWTRTDFRKFNKTAIVRMLCPGQTGLDGDGHFVTWCPKLQRFMDPAESLFNPYPPDLYIRGWKRDGCVAIVVTPPQYLQRVSLNTKGRRRVRK